MRAEQAMQLRRGDGVKYSPVIGRLPVYVATVISEPRLLGNEVVCDLAMGEAYIDRYQRGRVYAACAAALEHDAKDGSPTSVANQTTKVPR